MTKHFFTSDTHFFHNNIIKYCHRPFADMIHMNEVLVNNWNEIVGPDDTVWHLGDVSFGSTTKTLELLSRLNGTINLIQGNHDREWKKESKHFEVRCNIMPDYMRVQLHNFWFVLCHFPFVSWERKHINLHGHTHGTYKTRFMQHDVGVDVNNYRPISLDEVIKKAMEDCKEDSEY